MIDIRPVVLTSWSLHSRLRQRTIPSRCLPGEKQPTGRITAHMRSKIRRSFRSCAEAPDVPRSRPLCHPPDNSVGIRRVRRLDHLEVIQNDIHELSSPYRLVRAGCRSWALHQRFPVDPDLDWRSHRSASPPRITRPVYKPDHHAWNTLRSLTRT